MKYPLVSIWLLCLTVGMRAQNDRPVGINLNGVEDWSSELVFVDAFKQSRTWIAHDNVDGAVWDSGVTIPLGPNGYPLEIPFENGNNAPQQVRSLLFCGDLEGLYPSGNYRLVAEGTGRVRFWGAAAGSYTCPVDTLVSVDSEAGCVFIELEESQATDPVHDIRFVMPGHHDSYQTDPFHPELLAFVVDFSVLRFMDWMKTNGSPNAVWTDRTLPTDYTQTQDSGVAYEYLIELCNRTGKDPWICVPHRANDAYVTQLATLLRDQLDPERKIYLEYSNEVWNGIFPQNAYADSVALSLGYPGEPWERAWQYTAKRSADCFGLFGQVFAAQPDRVINVLPAWVNSWVMNYIIERFNEPLYNPTGQVAHAVAIAPYFGHEVGSNIGDAGQISTATVDDVLDALEAALPEDLMYAQQCKDVADQHGLPLLAYEGGQHLTGGAYHANDTLTQLLTAANRHPRMGELYCQYFDAWYDAIGGELFAVFASHSPYGQWGSWGIKEYYADTLSAKYTALQDCVFAFNTSPTAVVEPAVSTLQIFPQPAAETFTVTHHLTAPEIQLYDALGRLLSFRVMQQSDRSFTVSVPDYRGSAVLQLRTDKRTKSRVILLE